MQILGFCLSLSHFEISQEAHVKVNTKAPIWENKFLETDENERGDCEHIYVFMYFSKILAATFLLFLKSSSIRFTCMPSTLSLVPNSTAAGAFYGSHRSRVENSNTRDMHACLACSIDCNEYHLENNQIIFYWAFCFPLWILN